ncbi:MAG: SpoIIE family protein phosphatase [Nocardioides sp.]
MQAGQVSTPDRAALARQLADSVGDGAALSELSALAGRLLGAESAQVSLISDTQIVVGGCGPAAASDGQESPAADSLCSVTVTSEDPLVVDDAARDARVAALPPVRSGRVGSYLGVPLVVDDCIVGALCVSQSEARTWSDEEVSLLRLLVGPVVAELEMARLTGRHENERVAWQVAVDAAEVGAFDWDLGTGELRWDDRLLDLFGLDRDAFGANIEAFNEAVHPDDRDRVADALTAAIETCGVYTAEYRIQLPDGAVRWISARGRALAGRDGVADRVIGAAFDTTAVQDGEARVARVLEAMPSAFFHLDHEWRFTYLNSEAQRLLGATGMRVEGRVLWEAFPAAVGSEFDEQYHRAAATGAPVEFEGYYPPPLDRWYEVRAWPTPDGLSVYFVDITVRRQAQAAAALANERAVLLGGITEALAKTLDPAEAAAELARRVTGPLADWSVVTLVEHPVQGGHGSLGVAELGREWRRGLHDVAGWHVDPEARELVERYRDVRMDALSDGSFLVRALREGDPVVVPERATEALASVLDPGVARELCVELAPSAAAVFPLRGRGRTVGLLTVFRGAARGSFDPDELAVLTDAAGRAGLALDNTLLYAEQRDLAEGLQRSLMTAPPQPGHLELVVRYEPAAEAAQVGGDWYDGFQQTDGATNIVIGDVVGHDTEAAAAMGQIRGLLRGIAITTGGGPAEVLRRVDEAMQTLRVETTATAVVARLEQVEDAGDRIRLRWSNAGHPPPLVVIGPETPGGPVVVEALWSATAELLLGLDPDVERTESVLTLPREATVLLYTDGLVERRDEMLDVGVDRLRQVLADLVASGAGLDEVCDGLLRRMLPARPEDDVALVAVRLRPTQGPEGAADRVTAADAAERGSSR